jgi:hypothetical protein
LDISQEIEMEGIHSTYKGSERHSEISSNREEVRDIVSNGNYPMQKQPIEYRIEIFNG